MKLAIYILCFAPLSIISCKSMAHHHQGSDQSLLPSAPMVGGSCPTILSRADWGARPPTEQSNHLPDLLPMVFVHHSAMGECENRDSSRQSGTYRTTTWMRTSGGILDTAF